MANLTPVEVIQLQYATAAAVLEGRSGDADTLLCETAAGATAFRIAGVAAHGAALLVRGANVGARFPDSASTATATTLLAAARAEFAKDRHLTTQLVGHLRSDPVKDIAAAAIDVLVLTITEVAPLYRSTPADLAARLCMQAAVSHSMLPPPGKLDPGPATTTAGPEGPAAE